MRIEKLLLQLPQQWQERGGEIARLVAEELATHPTAGDLKIKRLVPAPLEVHPLATSREMAQAIAAAVHAEIRHQLS